MLRNMQQFITVFLDFFIYFRTLVLLSSRARRQCRRFCLCG